MKLNYILSLLVLLTSCADTDMSSLGQVLSQTGIVTGSQANSILKFGGSLSSSAKGFTEEQEYYLGRSVAATILSKYEPYNNDPLTAYVNKIAQALANVSDKPETFNGYHVMIIDTPEINAVSAPSGFIFISSGFINILPDEDSLAGIIAHEIAHIVKSHGTKAISEANLTGALVLLGKETASTQTSGITNQLTSALSDSVSDVTNTLLVKGFSRSQEYDSDAYAVELLKKAGYSESAMLTALSSLKTASKNGSTKGWMSTHPDPEDRLDNLDDIEKSPETPEQKIRASRFKKLASK